MPSPAGHLIAGAAIAWAAEAVGPLRKRLTPAKLRAAGAPALTPLVLVCAGMALAPDLDILLGSHRTYTHSLGAAVLGAALGVMIARWLRAPALAAAVVCAASIASHVLLDWLGRDSSNPAGLMALWPFSKAFFYSGADVFAEISRRYWKPDEFILKNAVSVARELLILGPLAAAAFWLRLRGPESRPQ